MAQRTLIVSLLVVLLVSAQAARPVGSKVSALAAIYAEDIIDPATGAVASRHLLQSKTTAPSKPKSAKGADTASRAFARMSTKSEAVKSSGRH